MNKSESIANLAKALSDFQSEVKQPMKDANNPFFKSKYVPLENVVEAITDISNKHGLSFTQYPSTDESGRIGVSTLLLHSSGEFIEYPTVYMKAEKENPQEAGKLISYLKRYSLSAIFGITSDIDDDANEATGNKVQSQQTVPSKKVEPVKQSNRVKENNSLNEQTLESLYNIWCKLDKQEQPVLFTTWYEEMKTRFSDDMIRVTLKKKIGYLDKGNK